MPRDRAADKAKTKAAKQKKLAIGGAVLLAILLVVQVPKTMKLLHSNPKPPVVQATASAPTSPTDTTALPAAASSAPAQLVSAVAVSPDVGQLRTFERFASKDPFTVQGSAASTATPAPAASAKPAATTTVAVTTPPPPAPTSAVISLNGVLMAVAVATAFPTSGPVFDRVGSLFDLVSLTRTTAKVTIVGGSYADGTPALTLKVGKPVTLQNTADGTRYTLVLEPQGTQLPATATSAPAATTTPGSIVPSGP